MRRSAKHELEAAIISAAAGGFLIAKRRSVPNITEEDALRAVLEMRRFSPDVMLSQPGGRMVFQAMGEMVIQKVQEHERVDPKG